ncbi:unnamed protein product, partial [Rotaria sp. Silwood2]
TAYFSTQHVIIAVQGPVEEIDLKSKDYITHVNGHPMTDRIRNEVVKSILSESEN